MGQVKNNQAIAGKYLTFALDTEEYGIGIQVVQEIVGMLDITMVPKTPAYMPGVVNLRGKIIPVVDLRIQFGMERADTTEETCMVVVESSVGEMALIVDRVDEVKAIATEQVERPPALGVEGSTQYLLGIGKSAESVLLLLDIDKVLSPGEQHRVRELMSQAPGPRDADVGSA